jgi:hypothetical protein
MPVRMDKALTTRRRVFDFVGAAGGVLILLLALAIMDQGIRHGMTGGMTTSADFSAFGEEMQYVSAVVALMVAQVVRGELADQTHLIVFMVTAAVLVMFLMRL